MKKDAKIYVAGATGLVGSALVRELMSQGYTQILTPNRQQVDLRDWNRVYQWFTENRPDYIFMAAALVGGIDANNTYPVDFLQDNLLIAGNVIRGAASYTGEPYNYQNKLLFFGSSCIYPRDCPQPIKEAYLLTGPLEPTNEWYAIAKIAALKLCQAYRRQHGRNFISVMPTNLYGPGDNYKPGCHVIPALIDRFHRAKYGSDPVVVWGDGTIRREFLYVDDLARAAIMLMDAYDEKQPVNIGYGNDISMKGLAHAVADVVELPRERLVWDTTKLTGTPRKLLDSSRIFNLGWQPKVDLWTGLREAYIDYLTHFAGKS